jgi:hypothetical protein
MVRLGVVGRTDYRSLRFPEVNSDLAVSLLIPEDDMNTHQYLRAYMAGSAVPTMMLLVVLSGFLAARYIFAIPIPIERAIIFPMALIPNIFGLWNMAYLWTRPRSRLSIGFHGAILPFFIAPVGFLVATCSGFLSTTSNGLVWFHQIVVPYAVLAAAFCLALIAYYLVWKYVVGFFNGVLGIA